MAKKKVAAKKSTNKKNPVKKVKSAKPAKKVAKKAAKKVAKAPVKKAAPKKATKVAKSAPAKKSSKASVKKAPVAKKVTATKKPAAKATPSALFSPALTKPTAPARKLDLTNFVTPLDDRLIVQVSGSERMTAGGLYIPDTVADTSGNLEGMVVAVGRGHVSKKGHLHPMDVQVGDKVVFPEFAGSKIKIQNEDLIILREGEVMGVVAK
ncbi:GroES family chaperonin [Bdellovibrio sp. HCB2-146]|uniref:GroES family chaperonin n=1 Tax=Bdellovibrio sp. HCB2-146 TaxID=3394362 RepID=UPI0039BD562E